MLNRPGTLGRYPFLNLSLAALFAVLSIVAFSEAALAARSTTDIPPYELRGGKPS